MPSVVVCTWSAGRDTLTGGDEEALTIGRQVCAGLDADLRLLAVGGLADGAAGRAAELGAQAIDTIDDAKLGEMSADVYVEALSQYCAAKKPELVLFNQTFDARLIAPRLAQRVHSGIVMNGVGLEARAGLDPDTEHEIQEDHIAVTTSAFGGDTRTVYALHGAETYIVCLNDNACLPEPAPSATSPQTESFTVDLSGVEERVRVIEKPKAEGPKLEDAAIIVAGGRGLEESGNFKLVQDLADALGGVAGASRPIVDDGWADAAQQVGLTGKITKPALYVAAGISGASQHMVGCSAAKTLVAINTDSDAAIFKHARFGIVGNCLEILPELTRAVKG